MTDEQVLAFIKGRLGFHSPTVDGRQVVEAVTAIMDVFDQIKSYVTPSVRDEVSKCAGTRARVGLSRELLRVIHAFEQQHLRRCRKVVDQERQAQLDAWMKKQQRPALCGAPK